MKKLVILFLFLGLAHNISAQESRRERFKAMKIAFLTEKMELTSSEAEAFWPIYNKYEEKFYQLKFVELGNIMHKLKKGELSDLSEAESKKTFDKIAELEAQIYDAEVKYGNELKGVISYKKIIYLKMLEEDFKRQLFEKLRKKREARNN